MQTVFQYYYIFIILAKVYSSIKLKIFNQGQFRIYVKFSLNKVGSTFAFYTHRRLECLKTPC